MTMLAGPVALDEARGWLRLGAASDDAVVERLLRTATNLCEAFTGQWLLIRAGEDIVPVRGGAASLRVRPLVGIDDVTLIFANGSEAGLGPEHYRLAIDSDGGAQLRIADPLGAQQARVRFRAGMAEDGAGVPDAIRHGILRMAQHLYGARDDAGASPPAAVAALWQPWRRVSLGGAR